MAYKIIKPGFYSFKLLQDVKFYELKKKNMTTLKLQTVYVPVPDEPAMGHVVWYGDTYDTNVQKLNNRIVMTPGELIQLFYDWEKSKYMYLDNFLKSKGIEI